MLKLFANFNPRALAVLGPVQFIRYAALFLSHLWVIVRHRDIRCVDRAMGRRLIRVRYDRKRFVIDGPFTDRVIQDGSYAFGLVRELYIRNCYLRLHPQPTLRGAGNVLDLGANRGVFSVMAAAFAHKVVAVEFLPEFSQVIGHNMAVNGFENFVVEPVFVGDGGVYDGRKQKTMTLEEILDKHNLATVDFLKMDIEGSEFSLFAQPSWLSRVDRLAMEVHTEFGDPTSICAALDEYGFDYRMADQMFRPIQQPTRQVEFLAAWKRPTST